MKALLSLLCLMTVPALLNAADPDSVLVREFIFDSTHAPTPSCHASTIVETPSGMVSAWFGGTAEGNPDVGIRVSRHVGNQWSAPAEVANGVQPDGKRFPCWNPVLFQPATGPLLLFYKVGPSPSKWWGMLRRSTDDGKTWSEAQRLPDGFAGPIKNKPVQLSDGAILCPSSTENQGWRAHFERTEDGGKTWQSTGPVNDGKEISSIQPSILFLGGSQLRAVGRTKQKELFEITSMDNGHTWGRMTLFDLPNPNSGTDAVTLKDGRHLLVYNHTSKGRSPLNVALSKDAHTWEAALVLESEPGEYSYPACIQAHNGQVHIVYTWKRRQIVHFVIDPAKLTTRPIVDGQWPK